MPKDVQTNVRHIFGPNIQRDFGASLIFYNLQVILYIDLLSDLDQVNDRSVYTSARNPISDRLLPWLLFTSLFLSLIRDPA